MKTLLLLTFTFLFSVATIGSSAQPPAPKIGPDPGKDMVTLYDEVNAQSAYQVITRIQMLQEVDQGQPIYLLIDSPGGSVEDGGKIISAIQASKRPIYTVDVGMAASMAAIIHSYGQKRLMFPFAVLMLHDASGGYDSDMQRGAVEVLFVQHMMDLYLGNIESRSGISDKDLKARLVTEWWLLTADAIKAKLVDGQVNFDNYPAPGAPKEGDSNKIPYTLIKKK